MSLIVKTFEIYEMIDLLEDFFTSNRPTGNITVGGMVGTFLFKHALESAMINHLFKDILVVEGCQDYIGIPKTSIPNFMYYADLFIESYKDSIIPYDPFKPRIMNPEPFSVREINVSLMNDYKVLIINDAHLIPKTFVNAIKENFCGKLCIIVDPFSVHSEPYCDVPTVVDSLNELPPTIAMARNVYGVETRSIDKSVNCQIKEAKINKRSIGKIDDKQYISNIPTVINVVRDKQLNSPFRTNHKVLVVSDKIDVYFDRNSKCYNVTKNTMFVVSNANTKPFMRLKIYNYPDTVSGGDITYEQDMFCRDNRTLVVPANILSVEESAYHKYKHAVLIEGVELDQRQKYSLLKNCQNITVAKM